MRRYNAAGQRELQKPMMKRVLFGALAFVLLFSGIPPVLGLPHTQAFAAESSTGGTDGSGDSGSGGTPPSGGTDQPPSGGTDQPPSGDGTDQPPSGGTDQPPTGDGTDQPPSGGTDQPPSGGTGGGTTEPQPSPKVMDVSIRLTGTNDYLAYASNPGYTRQTSITAKGGTIQFDNVVTWTDWSNDVDWHGVTWSLDNPAVASVSSTGIVTPLSDGTVKVSATVHGSDTNSGADLVASTWVVITGQTNARYVTGIRIADGNGVDLKGGPFTWEPDLSTDTQQFLALVDVFDPAKGTTQTYTTDGRLSSQAPDLSDLQWYVSDATLGAVNAATGLFRPLRYSILQLYVTSNAGLANAPVTASLVVTSKDPTGESDTDGFFPQPSLTIKAYYERYTPDEYGDDAYVIDITYSPEDLEAMGTFIQTYTAITVNKSSGGYYTMTGQGVPFATLLSNAGVNLAGVQQFKFKTADADVYDQTVSKQFIFDTARYYYPNIDLGRYNEAVQVYPMIALESNQRLGGSTDPDYDMSDGTRFRLLFGATPGITNSQFQVKWINTIYVILSGGPSTGEGDGGNPPGGPGGGGGTDPGTDPGSGGGGTDPGTYPGSGGGGTDPGTDPGSGGGTDPGSGGGGGSNPPGGNGSTDPQTPISPGGSGSTDDLTTPKTQNPEGSIGPGENSQSAASDSAQSDAADQTASEDGSQGSGSEGEAPASPSRDDLIAGTQGTGKAFNIYQIMNRNDSNTQTNLDFGNPLKRVVEPLGGLMLVAGGAEAFFWYRRQTRAIKLV